MSDFKKITTEELTANPFKLIGKDWMLITAGKIQHNDRKLGRRWNNVG